MAKETFDSLINDIISGKVISASSLRKYLNTMQIHSLRLQEKQINAMLSLLSSDAADKELGVTALGRENLSKELTDLKSVKPDADGTRVAASNVRFNYIYTKYIKLLNKTGLSKANYQLGHSVGVGTRVLQLLNELYDLKSGDSPEEIIRREKIIQSAIQMAHAIDAIDDKIILDIRRIVGAGHTKGATHTDLKNILNAVGDTIHVETRAEKITGAATVFGNVNPTLLKIEVMPETQFTNEFTGGLTARILDAVRGAFTGDSKKFDELLKNFDVYNMQGSPSAIQIISSGVDKAFGLKNTKDIKKANKKTNTKVRIKRRLTPTNGLAKQLKARVDVKVKLLKTKLDAQRKKKKFIIPTVTLKALLNESLAEFIRDRMARSTDTSSLSYLRNQTGRFSQSARILTLNRTETGAFLGTYTYMREPYEIFEQGEILGSPGRDPRLYIEGAAREIAVQVLKKQFVGLALEST